MIDDLRQQQYRTIGVLVHDFQLGGAERVAIRLANAWSELGCRVVVFAGGGGGLQRKLLRESVQVVIADPPLERGLRSTPVRLGQWVASHQQDIDAFYLPGNSYFTAVGPLARSGVPIYVTITNTLWRTDRSLLRNVVFAALSRWRLRKAAGVISMSAALLRQEQRVLGRGVRMTALANALFEIMPEIAKVERRAWLLCAVARLVPQKNIALLLRSFALLKDLPVSLVVVGDGVLMAELQQLAATLGIADRVRFLGAVSGALEQLAQAEVAVLSSDYEGFPAVAVEALAMGAFLVSGNCSVGMQDIITSEELGCIVPAQHAEDYAASLRAFFESAGRQAVARRCELAAPLVRAHLAEDTARRHLKFMGLELQTAAVSNPTG
jgi:glycosyltransferase involved in cell wall biosynthesis